MEQSECRSCGAGLEPGAPCRYCGQPGAAAPPAEPARAPTTAERIAAVRAHPDIDELLRTDDVRAPFPGQHIGIAAFGCFFAAMSIFMLVELHGAANDPRRMGLRPPSSRGPDIAFTVIPVLFICIGLGIAGKNVYQLVRKLRTELTSFPAAVLSRRTEVTRGKNSSSSSYHVGLELERSRRREFACAGALYSTLRDDEVGVAIARGDELIAFRPV